MGKLYDLSWVQVWKTFEEKFRAEQGRQVEAQVETPVRCRVWAQIGRQVREQVAVQVRSELKRRKASI